MPGPLPKPAGQRRRRNAVAGQRLLPREGYQGPIPELPPRMILDPETGLTYERPWPDVVVRWWERAWRSPMAVVWAENETDYFLLARLAGLTLTAMGGDPRAAAEARQLEDRLGLSPMARRRLVWEVEGEDPDARTAADNSGVIARRPAPAAPAVDPRTLRARP